MKLEIQYSVSDSRKQPKISGAAFLKKLPTARGVNAGIYSTGRLPLLQM